MANGEEQQGEGGKEQPKSIVDRVNDAKRQWDRAQNARKGAQLVQKGAQAIKAGAEGIRAGTSAAQGASAAAGMMGGAEGGAAAAGAGAAAGAAEGAGAAAAGAAAEGAAVATGAAAGAVTGGTVEFWGPIIAILAFIGLLVVLFIIIIAIITGGGGQKSDCELAGGKCQLGKCDTGFGQTSDACPNAQPANTPQTCCMPQQECGSLGGTCEAGPNCAGTGIGSGDCEPNVGKCQVDKCGSGFGETSNHCGTTNEPGQRAQRCCVAQKTCGSLGGKCQKGPTECASTAETASKVGTCTDAADAGNPLCCLPAATEIPSQVGTCKDDPLKPLCCQPISTASSSDIVSWAQQIINALKTFHPPCYTAAGPVYMYDVMEQVITNGTYTATKKPGSDCGIAWSTYFCTDLVIDAYNLAGLKNNFNDYVPTMINNWHSKGWHVLTQNNSASISQLTPGDVIFFMSNPNDQASGDHVAIISSVNVTCTTSNGCSGTISILQANSSTTTATFSVINGRLISTARNGHNQLMQPWFGLAGR